ncbi:MAG: class I SAM-dependent methyltransferase [Deltaproteobacteria bacterium]|nr:class I SAM-dependent methyltransferase [Deltaproteobacteria bacterium]MBW1847022.1 class I SAM-dependent methyltransferase [Deltaproteobacteria bacterium]MBW2179791.1 class I SAM-dependent methyltransferase [Deltaproteobacteria bacterium]
MAEHICPWWIGYLLVSPLRRLGQNPNKILAPYIKPGMTALDVGCGMGFFSLDMARLAGDNGKVICVDVQEKMIASLMKRATKSGLHNRIDHRVCSYDSLNLEDVKNGIDFALAFAIVHEVPDAKSFFQQIYSALKSNGLMLFSEPNGHVSEIKFQKTLDIAGNVGFKPSETLYIKRSRSTLLKK